MQLKFWLARVFGTRVEGIDWHNGTNTRVIGYRWRGNLYIVKITESL
jgi:hypothetical protein